MGYLEILIQDYLKMDNGGLVYGILKAENVFCLDSFNDLRNVLYEK